MMLTQPRIQELAEPIEAVYAHIADELLINIGKHVRSPTWTHTAAWEIQKLSELGQLTQENAAIINKWIKSIPQEIRDTMEATRVEALEDLEKQMQAAMKKGYLTPPLADSTVQLLKDLSEQAADRLNLVNTTMLQSSLDQYVRAIQLTAEDVRRAENTQRILNEAAASAVTGTETRLQAVRRAINRIADEGLTGFYDRAGRRWSPEAYVNMDVRTTVHNTAIQATRARMADYGTNVFQVSSHAGARPGCYPYQGKFYSWDNTSGEIPLGNGGTAHYEPVNSTTYGQPAGLFGINCGHYPIVVIPGYTIPHGADNIQPKAENDKAYAESQQQRALERNIREEKRRVEMLGSAATKEDKERVRQAQAQMKEFIEQTGRTRRRDREQIVKNAVQKPSARSTNVLKEYIEKAEPMKGSLTYSANYRIAHHKDEIKIAQWLHDNLGGDIELLTEKGKDIKTPDYLWRGAYWELKSPTTKKATDSAVRGALKQIAGNPGGIILNYAEDSIKLDDIIGAIDVRARRSGAFAFDVLVIQGEQLVTALRYKK